MYVYEEIRYSIESSHIKKKGNIFQIKKPDIFYIFSFSYLGKTHFHPTLPPCTDEYLEASLDSIDYNNDSVPKAWIRQGLISMPGITCKTNIFPRIVSATTILFWGLDCNKY